MKGALGRCLRSPRVLIGGGIALAILLAALFAPWLAPHDPGDQDLLNTLQPPMWQAGGERKGDGAGAGLDEGGTGRHCQRPLRHGAARTATHAATTAEAVATLSPSPLIPAQAGIQDQKLNIRFSGSPLSRG